MTTALDSSDANPARLRNLAAIVVTLSGAAQCFSLWLLPTTPQLLGTAFLGSLYLLLGLGLFGISRLSLLLAITLLPIRSWFQFFPLPIEAWEFLRIASDLGVAALCAPVLWASLDPDYSKVEPGKRLPRSTEGRHNNA